MQWFTLGPNAMTRLQETTASLRKRLGTSRVSERVEAMQEKERLDFVNEVLALLDESEAILARTRPEAPHRGLPNPFQN